MPLDHAPAELRFYVGVVEVYYGQGHPRIAPGVAGLERALPRTHEDPIAVEVGPHGRRLRRAVGEERGEVSEVGPAEERFDLLGERHAHARPSSGVRGARVHDYHAALTQVRVRVHVLPTLLLPALTGRR